MRRFHPRRKRLCNCGLSGYGGYSRLRSGFRYVPRLSQELPKEEFPPQHGSLPAIRGRSSFREEQGLLRKRNSPNQEKPIPLRAKLFLQRSLREFLRFLFLPERKNLPLFPLFLHGNVLRNVSLNKPPFLPSSLQKQSAARFRKS